MNTALSLEHVTFLIEMCELPQLAVPVKSARLAAEAYDTLKKIKTELQHPSES